MTSYVKTAFPACTYRVHSVPVSGQVTLEYSTPALSFDGEFADGSQTYAGTGTLRYSW